MTAPSSRSRRATSPDTRSGTSSPASPDGRLHFDLLSGLTSEASSPPLSPASPSPLPGADAATTTSGTSGPTPSISSASSALRASLGNRLRQRLSTDGSTEYSLTWSEKATPAQRLISRLRASARPTSGSGSTGWPTPNATDGEHAGTLARTEARAPEPEGLLSAGGLADADERAGLAGQSQPVQRTGPAGHARGLADADGRLASDGRVQRGGQYGLFAEDGGARGLADAAFGPGGQRQRNAGGMERQSRQEDRPGGFICISRSRSPRSSWAGRRRRGRTRRTRRGRASTSATRSR